MNRGHRTVGSWLPWLGAAAAFVVTLQTAGDVLDVPLNATPLVAVAAAAPLGLITTLPALGWLLSAGSALLVSRVYEVVDGDPWPWPAMHGVVLLTLLFTTGLRPRPWTRSPGEATGQDPLRRDTAEPDDAGGRRAAGGGRRRRSRPAAVLGELAVPVVATVATALLFAVSVPDHLRAGWAVGAAAAGVAGMAARRLPVFRRLPAEPPVPAADLPALMRIGLGQVALDWGPPPAVGAGAVAPWVRRYLPWLAAFVVFWTAISTVEASVEIHPLLVPVAGVAMALPAGLVDRFPLAGWRLATVVGIVLVLLGTPAESEYDGAWPVIFQWTWLATMFFVAVRYDRWTTVCAWAITVAAMLTGTGDDAGTAVTMIVAVTAIAIIGDLVRARRTTSRDLERQTELSELEKARRTVLEERSRIARDLHDVVAHHMSMVVVQAETAPYRIDGLSDDARAEFASISGSARQALDEIRGLLGVLRGADDALALAPQPGLAQLGDLVDGARRSGVEVELTTSGVPAAEVSAAAGLSAYRIVQESLANAVRHAPGAKVTVDVSYSARAVELRIHNTAPTTAAEARRAAGAGSAPRLGPRADAGRRRSGASGNGLPGMRERAAVVGGSLAAGPAADGGFAVIAVLPYLVLPPGATGAVPDPAPGPAATDAPDPAATARGTAETEELGA